MGRRRGSVSSKARRGPIDLVPGKLSADANRHLEMLFGGKRWREKWKEYLEEIGNMNAMGRRQTSPCAEKTRTTKRGN